MKTTTLLSLAAAASLVAFVASLLFTQDLVVGSAALAITMALLTLTHEYSPRSHFLVTPAPVRARKNAYSAAATVRVRRQSGRPAPRHVEFAR